MSNGAENEGVGSENVSRVSPSQGDDIAHVSAPMVRGAVLGFLWCAHIQRFVQ